MTFATATLGDLFEIARGGSPRPIDQYITDDPDGVNWIMIGDASASSKYIERTKKKIKPSGVSRSRRVKPGDFLLTNSMSFGRPYILKTDGCIHDGWLVMSPRRHDVHPDYFYHLLGSNVIYAEFTRRAAGATVKNLNIDLVKGVEVQFPPLEEQRRIAAILDAADALRTKRRAALAKLDTLAQSIFIEMFGDPVLNLKGWPLKPFGEIGTLDRGVSKHRPRNDPALLGGKHPFIQTGDVANCDTYIRNYTATYSDLGLSQSKMWEPGVLCITIAANIAKTGILTFRACFPDSVVGFMAGRTVTTEYVQVWLSFLQQTLEKKAPESAQKNINLAILRALPVPVPDLESQRAFSKQLAAIETLRSVMKRKIVSSESLFASLQHRAFRGELTAADEQVAAA